MAIIQFFCFRKIQGNDCQIASAREASDLLAHLLGHKSSYEKRYKLEATSIQQISQRMRGVQSGCRSHRSGGLHALAPALACKLAVGAVRHVHDVLLLSLHSRPQPRLRVHCPQPLQPQDKRRPAICLAQPHSTALIQVSTTLQQ